MRAQSLLLTSIAVVAALAASGCSSSEAPVPAGGAQWQLENVAGFTCQDHLVHKLALTVKDETGALVDRLLSDGGDGARVKCQVDGSRFSVSISSNAGSLVASGTLQGNASADATFALSTPSGDYASANGKPCTVTVTTNDGSSFNGTFYCPQMNNGAVPGDACGVTKSATSPAFFQFQNCSGF